MRTFAPHVRNASCDNQCCGSAGDRCCEDTNHNERCTDVSAQKSDPQNCGACNRRCQPGERCYEGMCRRDCRSAGCDASKSESCELDIAAAAFTCISNPKTKEQCCGSKCFNPRLADGSHRQCCPDRSVCQVKTFHREFCGPAKIGDSDSVSCLAQSYSCDDGPPLGPPACVYDGCAPDRNPKPCGAYCGMGNGDRLKACQ